MNTKTKIWLGVPLAAFLSMAGLAGCGDKKEEVVEEKKEEPVKVPDYAPTGDHANLKKAAAADITADNAAAKAKALEASLDKELAATAAPAADEEKVDEAATK